MTDPCKVLGFLDLAGSWDASLALFAGAALQRWQATRARTSRANEPEQVGPEAA